MQAWSPSQPEGLVAGSADEIGFAIQVARIVRVAPGVYQATDVGTFTNGTADEIGSLNQYGHFIVSANSFLNRFENMRLDSGGALVRELLPAEFTPTNGTELVPDYVTGNAYAIKRNSTTGVIDVFNFATGGVSSITIPAGYSSRYLAPNFLSAYNGEILLKSGSTNVCIVNLLTGAYEETVDTDPFLATIDYNPAPAASKKGVFMTYGASTSARVEVSWGSGAVVPTYAENFTQVPHRLVAFEPGPTHSFCLSDFPSPSNDYQHTVIQNSDQSAVASFVTADRITSVYPGSMIGWGESGWFGFGDINSGRAIFESNLQPIPFNIALASGADLPVIVRGADRGCARAISNPYGGPPAPPAPPPEFWTAFNRTRERRIA